MNETLADLVAEAQATGTLQGLPDGLFIDGVFTPSASTERLPSYDPGTGRPFAEVPAGNAEDVDRAVHAAHTALLGAWRRTTPAERGRILQRAAGLLREQAARFAVVECLDSGKRLSEAESDVRVAARAFEYYAGAADKVQGDSIPLGQDYVSWTVREPVGVAAQIIPWNYPLNTTARGVAPALAAGCTVVVKPAEQTPLSALMLGELLAEAGLPAGVYNVVTGTGEGAGAPLVAHEKVGHVTFTGSVDTGVTVMQTAARNVTGVTLELGGKSPLVVLADADVEAAVAGVRDAIFENAGQVCSAGSRLVVERALHDRMLERVTEVARSLTWGHGLRNRDLGAINSPEQLARITGYVTGASHRGLGIACGGAGAVDPESGGGWFFQPTVIDGAAPGDPVVQEEIFGPVLAVQVADDPESALALANGTRFGLAAGIYTRDIERALRLARDIDAGQVYINEYYAGGIETPFGGMRRSGFGREKGLEALHAYTRVKTVTARI
ncbi:MAG: aldehyde dehydrogenase family protein [Arenicellales bacterium]